MTTLCFGSISLPQHNPVPTNIISIRVILLRFGRTVSGRSPAPFLPLGLLAFCAACSTPVTHRHDWPSVPPVSLTPAASPPIIVVGFVGGVVRHDNPIHGEVILAEHLRAEYPNGVYVETFDNRRRDKALHASLRQLGAGRSGLRCDHEQRQARLILYRHRRGG